METPEVPGLRIKISRYAQICGSVDTVCDTSYPQFANGPFKTLVLALTTQKLFQEYDDTDP